jgi:hypothetical protein
MLQLLVQEALLVHHLQPHTQAFKVVIQYFQPSLQQVVVEVLAL